MLTNHDKNVDLLSKLNTERDTENLFAVWDSKQALWIAYDDNFLDREFDTRPCFMTAKIIWETTSWRRSYHLMHVFIPGQSDLDRIIRDVQF